MLAGSSNSRLQIKGSKLPAHGKSVKAFAKLFKVHALLKTRASSSLPDASALLT